MLILTIDTCTEESTLGLVRDGVVLAEAAFPSRHTLARRFFSRLEWLLAECGLTKGMIEAIALSQGPGSFTGVRLGAAAAKTLAQWMPVPLVSISTLEALAYPFRNFPDALLAPIINARRQQVYLALFRGESGAVQRLTPDLVLGSAAFAETLARHETGNRHAVLIGLVEGLPAEFLVCPTGPLHPIRSTVTPHALAALAEERLARGETDDPLTLAPIYLRNAAD